MCPRLDPRGSAARVDHSTPIRYYAEWLDGEYLLLNHAIHSHDHSAGTKWYILSFLAAMALESSLIVALVVEARKRRTSEKALKELSGQLIHAAEQKRQRVARELHDDFGQRLSLL